MTKPKPHVYRPFTTRDGSQACAECNGIPDSESHRPAERKIIRVLIVGDHPWGTCAGQIESLPDGNFEIINVLGTDMIKVKLDCGNECFAQKKNIRLTEHVA